MDFRRYDGSAVPAAEPVPETPVRPGRGGALAIIAGILFLLYAVVYAVDFIPGAINYLGTIVEEFELLSFIPLVLLPVLHVTGAVLAGVSLLSRKKTGGLVVGLGLLLMEFLNGSAGLDWCSSCFALALLLLTALVLFNGIPALQRKSRVLNRLWFLSPVFIGIGLLLFFVLWFRYITPIGVVKMLLLSMALVLFAIWNAVDSAPHSLAVKTGDALAVLGGVLLLIWAFWDVLWLLETAIHMPGHMVPESVFSLLRVGGYGLLGVLLLARKKNVGLLVGAALIFVAWMSSMLFNISYVVRSGDFGQLLAIFYFAFLVLLAVFNGIPSLRRGQPVINKLWFIPLLLFFTDWLLQAVLISTFSADLVVAVTAFALWCRAEHDV